MDSSRDGRSRAAEFPPPPAASLKFLYHNPFGRVILAAASGRGVSMAVGKWMSSRFSRRRIAKFVEQNGIDMTEYPEREYASFNDFFTRRIKPELRPVDRDPDALCAPCDARLSVFEIDGGSLFHIKNTAYSAASLLDDPAEAERYAGGLCLIFRLAVDNYHRVGYFDSGVKSDSRFIPGRLHTVQPIATESGHDIYARNCRSVYYLDSRNFGRAAVCYVGALLVGRIVEHSPGACAVERGAEAGMFEFGGSTVVLLLERDAAVIDGDILEASAAGMESRVKYGERIGASPRRL